MRRYLVFSVFAVLLAAAAWLATTRMTVTSDMGMFLPTGASPVQSLLVEQLRRGGDSRLIMLAIEGGDVAALAEANRKLARALRASGLFEDINNGQGGPSPELVDLLFRARYLLSPSVAPERFEAAGLREALRQRLDDLASATSPLVKRFLPADPTGEFLGILRLLTPATGVHREQGVLFSPDQRRSLMLLTTRSSSVALDAQAEALERIRSEFRPLAGQRLRLVLSGPAVFAVEARRDIRRDVQLLSALATVVVIGFLFVAFRSPRVVLLSAIPLVSGVLGGVAATTLAFGSVHGITIAFGSTLIGIAVDYPMHFFSHLVGPGPAPWVRFRPVWPTLRLGVLTTMIGFTALVFSNYGGLVQLGVFSIVGLAAAAATTRWVLPAAVPDDFFLPPVLDRVQQRLHGIAVRAPRRRLWVLLAGLAAAAALWQQGERLWENDPARLSPITEAERLRDRQLRDDLNAPFAAHALFVSGSTRELALERTEALVPRLQALVGAGALDSFETVTRLLPSFATQRARQAALPTRQQLEAALHAAQRGLPFRSGLFKPFVDDVAAARTQPPLTPQVYDGTLLGERVRTLLFESAGRWVSAIPLAGVHDAKPLAALATRLPDGAVYFVDIKAETMAMMAAYRDRALEMFTWGALGIFAALLAGLRSPGRALRVIAAPAVVVLLDAALLTAVGGMGLTLFHLVALLLVVGLGIDYALFFHRLGDHPDEWASTFPALWKSWLTTVLVFGSLMLSNTVVLQAIGLTVCIGVTLCFVIGGILAPGGRAKAADLN